ncbi:MAG: hypothetical protein GTN81_00760 [Proteobacteria bacterium]|nr:hypothetical protein [Pseudomonadota bacterium]
MKTVVKGLVFLFILGTCAMTIASSLSIEADTDSITGSADGAPMGEVLKILTERMGWEIYVDSELLDTPVSFNIEEKLEPEKAIQRMVNPHSYAMVFDTDGRDGKPRIQKIWIFRQGAQHLAHYIPLITEDPDFVTSPAAGEDRSRSAAPLSALTAPDQKTEAKGLVRRDLRVERSAFGTPVVRARDGDKGPNYRPSVNEMRLAYERYRLARHREERRMAEIESQEARANYEKARQAYFSSRNQALKNQILQLKQK